MQDNCVIHVALDHGTTIGEDVTVGHGAMLERCDVEDGAVIGINAVVLEHARIGADQRAFLPPLHGIGISCLSFWRG